MSELLVLFLESPVMQISLAVLIGVIGLFIVAAIQRRLGKLTAILLSVVMLVSLFVGTADGIRRYGEKTGRTRMLPSEKEALTALAAGDTRKAYAKAIESILAEPDRPPSVLTAARAALLTGDLAAADQFYGQLQSLSADDLDDWNMSDHKEEISRGDQLSDLPKHEAREAAGSLSQMVKEKIDREIGVLPDIQEASDNYSSVLDLENLLYEARQAESHITDMTAIDQQLYTLMDKPGGEGARDLLIESMVWQEQWGALLPWLLNDGAPGLLDLADLVLEGSLPEGVLAGALLAGSDLEAVEKLADRLWSMRSTLKSHRGRLHLILGKLYAQLLKDYEKALAIIHEALHAGLNLNNEDLAILRELDALRLMLEWMGEQLGNHMLTDYLGDFWEGWGGNSGQEDPDPDDLPPEETSAPDEPDEIEWPPELSGESLMRHTHSYNICAPEMTQAGRIRFYVTMAAGTGGFPPHGAPPEGTDFAFRTNIGFHKLLTIHSMTPVDNIERYTMLLIDRRPSMSREALDLAKTAALAYVRSMPEGEKVLVYNAGLPWQDPNLKFTEPGEKIELFGNREMETFLFSSDKARLEAYIRADYPGDAFDDPNIYHTISWALNQMTAISERGVSGDWESFPLTSAIPRFGQVIFFTNGASGSGQIAGGEKTIEYIRGAAIAANAVVHIVRVGGAENRTNLRAIADAGRGSIVDPSVASLSAFYQYVRNREVRIFLADCAIPEYPVNQFFELRARHTPTGLMAGFKRNPGRGIDLVGTLHYSDASLRSEDFHDYTGDDLDDSTGDPFDPGGTEPDDSQGDLPDDGQTDGQDWYQEIDDWQGMDSLRVDGLDRHAIARSQSGLMLVNLLGQGFEGLSPSNIKITFSGLGTVQPAYLNILNDHEIQFFLPVTMPTGTYSMRVEIGGRLFTFTDTLFVYDADGFTTIRLGPWTITASSAENMGTGKWNLSAAVINDYLHFDGNSLLEGHWQAGDLNQLKLTPGGSAYIEFSPGSQSFLVKEIFLKQGTPMYLGKWNAFTLTASGEGVPFYADTAVSGLSLGLIDLPYDSGTLHPQKLEVPIIKINLDLPFQQYLLMYNGLLPCTAKAEAIFTANQDTLDLKLAAELSSEKALNFMSALNIEEFGFEIDTSEKFIAVDLGVDLIGGKGFKAHVAFKGWMLDEIGLSIEVEIPVTATPIPISLTEFGGGLKNMAAGSLLNVTMIANAKFEAASATAVLPFLSSLPWLPADKIPPLLATKDTQLELTLQPFLLAFSTELSLFDEISIGEAKLKIGQFPFNQTLLNISDQEAYGLSAKLQLGPEMDFSIVRLVYRAGPQIDVNNHGLFIALNGTAGFGMNVWLAKFTADLEGTFLVAIHEIPTSDWPQLSIVANISPTSSVPGLWTAGEPKDIRLLVNQSGFYLIGIPSPMDGAIAVLKDLLNTAGQKTWEAITEGMEALADAGEKLWNILGSGAELAGQTWDSIIDTIAEGGTLILNTGEAVVEAVEDFYDYVTETASEVGDAIVTGVQSGFTGIISTGTGVVKWIWKKVS